MGWWSKVKSSVSKAAKKVASKVKSYVSHSSSKSTSSSTTSNSHTSSSKSFSSKSSSSIHFSGGNRKMSRVPISHTTSSSRSSTSTTGPQSTPSKIGHISSVSTTRSASSRSGGSGGGSVSHTSSSKTKVVRSGGGGSTTTTSTKSKTVLGQEKLSKMVESQKEYTTVQDGQITKKKLIQTDVSTYITPQKEVEITPKSKKLSTISKIESLEKKAAGFMLSPLTKYQSKLYSEAGYKYNSDKTSLTEAELIGGIVETVTPALTPISTTHQIVKHPIRSTYELMQFGGETAKGLTVGFAKGLKTGDMSSTARATGRAIGLYTTIKAAELGSIAKENIVSKGGEYITKYRIQKENLPYVETKKIVTKVPSGLAKTGPVKSLKQVVEESRSYVNKDVVKLFDEGKKTEILREVEKSKKQLEQDLSSQRENLNKDLGVVVKEKVNTVEDIIYKGKTNKRSGGRSSKSKSNLDILNKDESIVYHATSQPIKSAFLEEFETLDNVKRRRDSPGMYFSYSGIAHRFLRLKDFKTKYKFSLLPDLRLGIKVPEIIAQKVKIERLPDRFLKKLEKIKTKEQAQKFIDEANEYFRSQEGTGRSFITPAKELSSKGLPRGTSEGELVTVPKSKLKNVGKGYTIIENKPVIIKAYDPKVLKQILEKRRKKVEQELKVVLKPKRENILVSISKENIKGKEMNLKIYEGITKKIERSTLDLSPRMDKAFIETQFNLNVVNVGLWDKVKEPYRPSYTIVKELYKPLKLEDIFGKKRKVSKISKELMKETDKLNNELMKQKSLLNRFLDQTNSKFKEIVEKELYYNPYEPKVVKITPFTVLKYGLKKNKKEILSYSKDDYSISFSNLYSQIISKRKKSKSKDLSKIVEYSSLYYTKKSTGKSDISKSGGGSGRSGKGGYSGVGNSITKITNKSYYLSGSKYNLLGTGGSSTFSIPASTITLPKPTKKITEMKTFDPYKIKGGYDVYVKEKGKWIKVPTKHKLDYVSALNVGAKAVDNSSAVSFKVVKSGHKGSKLYSDISILNKFKFSKKNPKVFVEKETFRIDTTGEHNQITALGWISQKFGKKKRGPKPQNKKLKFKLF